MGKHQNDRDQFKIMRQMILAALIWSTVICGEIAKPARQAPEAFRYRNSIHRFSLNLPAKWTVREGLDGTSVSAVRPSQGPADSFLESINVVVQKPVTRPAMKQFLVKNVSQLKKIFKNFQLQEQGRTNLKRGEGSWIVYTYDLDRMTIRSLQSFLLIDDKAFVITGSASALTFPQYRPIFQTISDSFVSE